MLTEEDLKVITSLINDAISEHDHGGFGSQRIIGETLVFAPQAKITSVSSSPTTGGANNLKAADAAVITDLKTATNLLITELTKLGLLQS